MEFTCVIKVKKDTTNNKIKSREIYVMLERVPKKWRAVWSSWRSSMNCLRRAEACAQLLEDELYWLHQHKLLGANDLHFMFHNSL